MNRLTLDNRIWEVHANIDGTYRVIAQDTQTVLAPSLSLSLAVQIVDEHDIVHHLANGHIYGLLMAKRQRTPIVDVDGTRYLRA